MRNSFYKQKAVIILVIGLTLISVSALIIISPAEAALPAPSAGYFRQEPADGEEDLSISDERCLECHDKPGETMELENGEQLSIYVPAEAHYNSIHGALGYTCVQCHTTVGDHPHRPFSAEDRRDVTLQKTDLCQRCHPSQYESNQDGVHAAALAEGNRNAAVCADCHTAHDVQRLIDPETRELLPEAREWVPVTCGKCHSELYEKYRDSVHGKALYEEGNPDVPVCTDCHGVHDIEDPTTAEFKLKSPEICADCHTDPEIMDKYGITTDVLDTYVADFHGTSVLLFEQEHPDQQFNKPVCIDCHGAHDIASKDDPVKGLQVQQNLLQKCQVCHPEATENFPAAWLSHFRPSLSNYPLVYLVNVFYIILVPFVLVGMSALVVLDANRRRLNRKQRKQHLAESENQEIWVKSEPETGTEQMDKSDENIDSEAGDE
jgi:hypothetical protein